MTRCQTANALLKYASHSFMEKLSPLIGLFDPSCERESWRTSIPENPCVAADWRMALKRLHIRPRAKSLISFTLRHMLRWLKILPSITD